MSRFLLILLCVAPLCAEPLKLSRSLFTSPDFKKSFAGSYGFLPIVEPQPIREEITILTELSDLIATNKLREAEVRIRTFIHDQKNPPPPKRRSKEPAREPRDVSPAFIFLLGNIYFQNGQLGKAEKHYKQAIERHKPYRRAHKNLALLYARQNKIAEAKPYLMKAIDLGDADHRSFGLLGFAYLQDEEALAAEAAYRQAYLLKPTELDWKLGLARSLLAQENWVEAASMLQTLLNESPNNASYWKQQANCFIQTGDIMRAAENYEILRLKGLADESSLDKLGDIYAKQEQPLLALGAYMSAIQKAKMVNVPRSLKAAKYLLRLKAPEHATRLIDELEARGAQSMTREQKVDALIVRSDIAKAERDLASASLRLTEALEVDPTNGEARVFLARLFVERAERISDPEQASSLRTEARKNFTLVLDDTDEQIAFQANLRYGQMLAKQGEYIKALPKLEEAVRLKKGSKQLVEQFLRRVQRAAERQKAREERLLLERQERRDEQAKRDAKARDEQESAGK